MVRAWESASSIGVPVSAYIAWLAERPDTDGALREPRARDYPLRV